MVIHNCASFKKFLRADFYNQEFEAGVQFWGKNGPFGPNKNFFAFFFFWYLIIRPILQKILGAHFKLEICTVMDPNSDKKSPFSPKWKF